MRLRGQTSSDKTCDCVYCPLLILLVYVNFVSGMTYKHQVQTLCFLLNLFRYVDGRAGQADFSGKPDPVGIVREIQYAMMLTDNFLRNT